MAEIIDFKVKNGLIVSTTATINGTTQSSSTTTGALIVAGGAGIGQDLYVGGTIYGAVTTASTINTVEQTSTNTHYLTFVDSNNTTTTAENVYTTSSFVIVPSNGSVKLYGTLQSTGTVSENSLYVQSGVGIEGSLYVKGPVYFDNSVVFSGTSTYVYSTNTIYTDNLINLHTPSGSTGTNHSWSVNDGQDIGFVLHYYLDSDKDAALVLANDSGYLEWYSDGTENLTNGTFTGTSYGVFKTGSIKLVHTTSSNSTTTGALTVAGGVGVGQDLYVGGTIYGTINGTLLGNANTVSTVRQTSAGTHYLTFVDSNNASATAENVYTTSSFVIVPSTGNVGIGTSSPQFKVHISNSVGSDASYTGGLLIENTGSPAGESVVAFKNTDTGANYWFVGLNQDSNLAFTYGSTFQDSNTKMNLGSDGNLIVGGSDAAFTNGSGIEIQRTGTATLRLDSGTFATELYGYSGGTGLVQLSSGYLDLGTNNLTRLRIYSNGNISVNTTTDSGYTFEVSGSFAAITKSFVINHPTKPGMKLRYGSLEGPENGVYVRGKLNGSNHIELPEYWTKLVDPESITVNLTPIGRHQNLYVEEIINNTVIVKNSNLINKEIHCYYTVYAERIDVTKLQVEI